MFDADVDVWYLNVIDIELALVLKHYTEICIP